MLIWIVVPCGILSLCPCASGSERDTTKYIRVQQPRSPIFTSLRISNVKKTVWVYLIGNLRVNCGLIQGHNVFHAEFLSLQVFIVNECTKILGGHMCWNLDKTDVSENCSVSIIRVCVGSDYESLMYIPALFLIGVNLDFHIILDGQF